MSSIPFNCNVNSSHSGISKIVWPAFIKLNGDDELIYINSAAHWQNANDIHDALYTENDYLIDSAGNSFSLSNTALFPGEINNALNKTMLIKADGYCSLEQALGFVKAYAAQENYCCSAKIYADDFKQLLTMIKSINELNHE